MASKEIYAINEILVAFASELKYTNEHLAKYGRKIEEFESQPKMLPIFLLGCKY